MAILSANPIVFGLTFATLLCIGSVIIRVYFSPLSKIPGPRLAAVTSWWEAWIDLFYGSGGRFYFELQKLHDKHGPIVRIGPSEVHISDPEWLRVLFGRPGAVRDKHKSLAHIIGSNQATFGTVDHHLHRMRRNAVAPFFSKRAVNAIEPRIRAGAEQMCRYIDSVYKDQGKPCEIRVAYLAWFTDTLTSYIFDRPTDLLGDGKKAQEWFDLYKKLDTLYPILKQNTWIVPLAFKLPLPIIRCILPELEPVLLLYKEMEDQAKVVWQDYKLMATDGKENYDADEIQPNIFRTIVCSSIPEHEKDWKRMAHEGLEIFLAGGSTVSRAMTTATYHILANPEVAENLRAELERLMPDPAVIPEVKTLETSAYLAAVMKESLRIAQVITFRHPVVAREDLIYKGHRLPAGIAVSATTAYCLQDPIVYPDPKTFVPARWLESSESQLAEMERYFLAFGLGNRACLGTSFAKAEFLVGLAVIFRRYTWELVDTTRKRDVDHSRAWIVGEPSIDSPGIFVRPLTSWRDQN